MLADLRRKYLKWTKNIRQIILKLSLTTVSSSIVVVVGFFKFGVLGVFILIGYEMESNGFLFEASFAGIKVDSL